MRLTTSTIKQAGVIPFRAGRICLVTSRSGRRWVIPKGRIEAGQSAGEAALQEAWEEAGLIGVLHPEPAGSFVYHKTGMAHHVTLFPMSVTEIHDDWPELDFRTRQWMSLTRALGSLEEPGLCDIIRNLHSAGLFATHS